MKKEYSEPGIVYNDFSLCSSIAAGCGKKIGTMYNGTCGVPYGEKFVFTLEVSGCETKVEDGSPMFNGLCYHVPIDANSLFNS